MLSSVLVILFWVCVRLVDYSHEFKVDDSCDGLRVALIVAASSG